MENWISEDDAKAVIISVNEKIADLEADYKDGIINFEAFVDEMGNAWFDAADEVDALRENAGIMAGKDADDDEIVGEVVEAVAP